MPQDTAGEALLAKEFAPRSATTTLNTADLIGPALDWAFAKAEGLDAVAFGGMCQVLMQKGAMGDTYVERRYHDNPTQMWPIIDRERINLVTDFDTGEWFAGKHGRYGLMPHRGPTSLIAAARCWVAHKLGPTVQVPSELVA